MDLLFSIYSTEFTQYVLPDNQILHGCFFSLVCFISLGTVMSIRSSGPTSENQTMMLLAKTKVSGLTSTYRGTKQVATETLTCLINTVISLLHVFIGNYIFFLLRLISLFNLLLTHFLFCFFCYDMSLGFLCVYGFRNHLSYFRWE